MLNVLKSVQPREVGSVMCSGEGRGGDNFFLEINPTRMQRRKTYILDFSGGLRFGFISLKHLMAVNCILILVLKLFLFILF